MVAARLGRTMGHAGEHRHQNHLPGDRSARPEKSELKLRQHEAFVIPPEESAAFVAVMEDGLDVYKRPEEPNRPLVCPDECPKQLVGETRNPIPAAPGQSARYDYEYVRRGTCNVFMIPAPLRGWRRVAVTARRTRLDWAEQIRRLVEEDFPGAEKIVLVTDNLNTREPTSLYATFPPERAKRFWDRLEIHHTPKHGSRLNMLEIELSVLNRQGLSRRVPGMDKMVREVSAWGHCRNQSVRRIDWRFTTADAKIKLKRLYPRLHT